MDLFSEIENKGFQAIPHTGGELLLWHDFLSPADSNTLFDTLIDTIAWKEAYLEIYGKRHCYRVRLPGMVIRKRLTGIQD